LVTVHVQLAAILLLLLLRVIQTPPVFYVANDWRMGGMTRAAAVRSA
jgi:hypothetical protein